MNLIKKVMSQNPIVNKTSIKLNFSQYLKDEIQHDLNEKAKVGEHKNMSQWIREVILEKLNIIKRHEQQM